MYSSKLENRRLMTGGFLLFAVFSADFSQNFKELRLDDGVGSNDADGVLEVLAAAKDVGCHAACFLNDQPGGCNVPVMHTFLPKAIQPARGHIGQVQRGGPQPADGLGGQ